MIKLNANEKDFISYTRQSIKSKFLKEVHTEVCQQEVGKTKNIKLNNKDIEKLFDLYDNYFFEGELKKALGNNIVFSLSKRMTSAGGKTIFRRNSNSSEYEIRISLVILNNFYLKTSEKKVSGIIVSDPIEALMLIMEHEICHVVEFYNYGDSNCKGKSFRDISSGVFNHKGIYHDIPTRKNLNPNLEISDISIGDKVSFIYRGKKYVGIVANITKRATVMVLDKGGAYKDKEGNRYTKWYVPIINLSK